MQPVALTPAWRRPELEAGVGGKSPWPDSPAPPLPGTHLYTPSPLKSPELSDLTSCETAPLPLPIAIRPFCLQTECSFGHRWLFWRLDFSLASHDLPI